MADISNSAMKPILHVTVSAPKGLMINSFDVSELRMPQGWT